MNLRRGDAVLAWFPHASGSGGKRRPCVVVQNDVDNQKITNTMVAFITSTLSQLGDKSHVFIDVSTPEGQQTGVMHNSLISCNNVATIEQKMISAVVGSLGPNLLRELNGALKFAFELP